MAYVHEHYAEPPSLVRMASRLGVSVDHLTRCFRSETGVTPRIYASRSVHANEWVQESVTYNDDIIDVYAWHNYGGDATNEAATVHGWMDQYDMDGVHEPFYLSEWGNYDGSYGNLGNALKHAKYLISRSASEAGHIDGDAVFSLYTWRSGVEGLILPNGTKTYSYYSMRNVIRGLQGGKQKYGLTGVPSKAAGIAAVDGSSNTLHVTFVNTGGGSKSHTVTLDVSAHTMSGTASVYRFDASMQDELVGTPAVVNGQVVFGLPVDSAVTVVIPISPPLPTDTPVPPTSTPGGPTDTPISPTDTPVPPTDTPVPPTDTPAPTNTPGGGSLAFFDGFEDGDLNGWSTSGNASASGDTPYQGNYRARFKYGGSMWQTVSTAGCSGIHPKYAGRAKGVDAGEYMLVEWYDGSTWTTIEQLTSETYVLRDWTLPAGSADNPDFAIRFTGVADKNVEWGDVDNVEVTGQ